MKRPQGPSTWGRPRNSGMRMRSTFGPSRCRAAGRTLREPIIAARTTIIVPAPIEANSELPLTNIPAIAISTVEPEIEHGLAGCAGCAEESVGRREPAVPLLALAPDVEQRVVDSDRHPEHEDDRAERLLVRRDQMAREGVQAGRGEHGGEGEEEGKPGGDERAKGDDEDARA